MAETRLPILRDGLTLPEKVMLASLSRHIGFPVLIKLLEAMCEVSTKSMVKLDPELENYDRLLAVRQQESRTTHRNSKDLLDSIEYHKQSVGGASEDLDNQLQLEGE